MKHILDFEKHRIILASQSPRRQQLLKDMGFNFEVRTDKDIEETFPENLKNQDIATYLAELKFNAYQSELAENDILITADTIVCIDGLMLGKPNDKKHAIEMLERLSGKSHFVYTGITVGNNTNKITSYDSSEVFFKKLSSDEIEWYIDTYKPYDKAGSYGVQEWIGYVGIEKIIGSFYNVMGLPTQKLFDTLKLFM
jgi:septum formation protein